TLAGGYTSSPHALAAPPPGLTTPNALAAGITPAFRNPRSLQSALSLDRRISSKLELTAGYVYSSSWRLEQRLDENLFPPIAFTPAGTPIFGASRPITGVGRLLVEQSTAHSSYHGGYISLNAPISRRTTLLANYTLSRTQDDNSSSAPTAPSPPLIPSISQQ